MTEAKWLTSSDPEAMRQFICSRATERQGLLYMVAWCRCSPRTSSPDFRTALNVAERYVDGLAPDETFRHVGRSATLAKTVPILMGPKFKANHPRFAKILRDVIGNPFRSVKADPAWFTPTVVALAESAYDERAFDRLPILADALQDAGCDRDDLLSHLRDPDATHVRGCWALDLVLGKE
jgi:hypothetical protein